MINPANNAQTNVAQYYTNSKSPKKLSDGKPLQVCGEEQLLQNKKKYDTLSSAYFIRGRGEQSYWITVGFDYDKTINHKSV